jgi:type VI protein secretion system component Hcp
MRSCDICGSPLGVKVYSDKATGVSFRACWRGKHRQQAKLALARRAAIMKKQR